jgi:hypothetical protein
MAFLTTLTAGTGWQNPRNAQDVNDDDDVTPLDVLILINYINSHPRSTALPAAPAAPPPYYDVSDDGQVTPRDVLLVINYINAHPLGAGEGETVADVASSRGVEGLPSFGASPTVLLQLAPVQQPSVAPTDVQPWPTVGQSLLPSVALDSGSSSASPAAATAACEPFPDGAMRTRLPDDMAGVFAELDAVLPDIAKDVLHGWELGAGRV